MALIVPIAASSGIFAAPDIAAATHPEDRLARHAQLAEAISAHGALIFENEQAVRSFWLALKELEDPLHEEWSVALERTRIRVCDTAPIPQPLHSSNDVRAWSEWAGLACVPPSVWETLVPQEAREDRRFKFKVKQPRPPARVFETINSGHIGADRAESLGAARALSRYAVPAGLARDSFADYILKPLLRYAVTVVLVDTYLGKELVANDHVLERSALEWFLEVVEMTTRPILRNSQLLGADVVVCTTTSSKDASEDQLKNAASDLFERVMGRHRDDGGGVASFTVRAMPRQTAIPGGGTRQAGQALRLIEVGHGTQVNDYGRADRRRETKALTHLGLTKGLTPLGPSGFTKGWESDYSSPASYQDLHRARARVVQQELESQEEYRRRPLLQLFPPARVKG